MRSLLLFCLLTLSSCKAAVYEQKDQRSSLQSIVTSELGSVAAIENNKPGTFALAYSINNRSLKYIVVRLADLKIVIRQKIVKGSIAWSEDLQLKETHAPEMVKKNASARDNTRLIDLKNYVVQGR
jgi:hypothetical protein